MDGPKRGREEAGLPSQLLEKEDIIFIVSSISGMEHGAG
jgi:hypothetical protein